MLGFKQLTANIKALESEGIQHNDIKHKEVLVKDANLYLIRVAGVHYQTNLNHGIQFLILLRKRNIVL